MSNKGLDQFKDDLERTIDRHVMENGVQIRDVISILEVIKIEFILEMFENNKEGDES